MPHLDALSFFVVVLLLSAAVFVGLFNRNFPKRLRYVDGLRFLAVWMLFTVVVLVMNQIGRETLDPGRWPRERLFHGLEGSHPVGYDSTVVNFLFGWFLFPLRVIPHSHFYLPALLTGIVATVLAAALLEFCGRLFLGSRWRIRWSVSLIAAFATLFLTTYATVGLARQIGWIFFS